MFIRKFLCEAVSFASWRDLNQLYSLPHKAVDCVSFCAALNVLFASVRRRYNLGPTPYSSLPQCGHVLLLTLFFLDVRVVSLQGSNCSCICHWPTFEGMTNLS